MGLHSGRKGTEMEQKELCRKKDSQLLGEVKLLRNVAKTHLRVKTSAFVLGLTVKEKHHQ